MVVGRKADRLQHEYLACPHVFFDLHVDLAVAEPPDGGLAEHDAQMLSDGASQGWIRVAREQHDGVIHGGSDISRSTQLKRVARGLPDRDGLQPGMQGGARAAPGWPGRCL